MFVLLIPLAFLVFLFSHHEHDACMEVSQFTFSRCLVESERVFGGIGYHFRAPDNKFLMNIYSDYGINSSPGARQSIELTCRSITSQFSVSRLRRSETFKTIHLHAKRHEMSKFTLRIASAGNPHRFGIKLCENPSGSLSSCQFHSIRLPV